jgi:hypothetical protein
MRVDLGATRSRAAGVEIEADIQLRYATPPAPRTTAPKHAQAVAETSIHRRPTDEGKASRNPLAIPRVKPAAASTALRARPAATAVVTSTPRARRTSATAPLVTPIPAGVTEAKAVTASAGTMTRAAASGARARRKHSATGCGEDEDGEQECADRADRRRDPARHPQPVVTGQATREQPNANRLADVPG